MPNQRIPGERILPVTVMSNPETAVRFSALCLDYGISRIEITLRTPTALACISAVSEQVPGILIGAGTVLRGDDGRRARDAGAQFIVTPGFTPELLSFAKEIDIPVIPGFATVSEAMIIATAGLTEAKFFPAESSGGTEFLKSLSAVLPELMVFPTGGIRLNNIGQYLQLPNVLRVGGTWLSASDPVTDSDWHSVSEVLKQTLETIERTASHG